MPDEVVHSLIRRGGRWRAQWRALTQDGLRGLARIRHLHQQCAELVFKKMRHHQRPDEPRLLEEVDRLRNVVRALVEKG